MEAKSLFILILILYCPAFVTCISQLKNQTKLKLSKDIFKRIMFQLVGLSGEGILLSSLYHSEFSISSQKKKKH